MVIFTIDVFTFVCGCGLAIAVRTLQTMAIKELDINVLAFLVIAWNEPAVIDCLKRR
jgi:hypothetical protein